MTHPDFTWMNGTCFEPAWMPHSVKRRRATARRVWLFAAAAFVLAGGFLGAR